MKHLHLYPPRMAARERRPPPRSPARQRHAAPTRDGAQPSLPGSERLSSRSHAGGRGHLDTTSWEATRALTASLLRRDFGLAWWLPEGQLVPPVTNRANYVHWVNDLLHLSAPAEGGAGHWAKRRVDPSSQLRRHVGRAGHGVGVLCCVVWYCGGVAGRLGAGAESDRRIAAEAAVAAGRMLGEGSRALQRRARRSAAELAVPSGKVTRRAPPLAFPPRPAGRGGRARPGRGLRRQPDLLPAGRRAVRLEHGWCGRDRGARP
jgi:hypothetical protein